MINSEQITFLDCTLRDGGQLFESLHLRSNRIIDNPLFFYNPLILTDLLLRTGLDIVEVGVINEDGSNLEGVSVYNFVPNTNFLNSSISEGQQLSILFKGPNLNLDLITIQDYPISIARVVIRYSEIEQSLQFCKKLIGMGYKVSIQPMVTARYTQTEILRIIDFANSNNIYALYIVDSYGYMDYSDLNEYFNLYDRHLLDSIQVGLHLHNNNSLSLANILRLFEESTTQRRIIVDSSIMGLGLGAGNLKTEEILLRFNRIKRFSYRNLMLAVEEIEKYYQPNVWGYSLIQLLSSHFKLTYKYSEYMRYELKLNYHRIFQVLEKVDGDRKHLFDSEYCHELIRETANAELD
jgi:4-hydroxy 2-oxovalerate aldolase